MSTTTISPSRECFACGSDNPAGLHLSFSRAPEGGSRAEYTTRPEHIGWQGIIHGGIVFTLLDEAVAWALALEGLRGVTARADARFRAPVRVGMDVVVTGRIVERSRRLVKARAELRDAGASQDVLAELDAVMYLADTGGELAGVMGDDGETSR